MSEQMHVPGGTWAPVPAPDRDIVPVSPFVQHEAARNAMLRLIRNSTTMNSDDRDMLLANVVRMDEAMEAAERLVHPAPRRRAPLLQGSFQIGRGAR